MPGEAGWRFWTTGGRPCSLRRRRRRTSRQTSIHSDRETAARHPSSIHQLKFKLQLCLSYHCIILVINIAGKCRPLVCQCPAPVLVLTCVLTLSVEFKAMLGGVLISQSYPASRQENTPHTSHLTLYHCHDPLTKSEMTGLQRVRMQVEGDCGSW